MDRKYPLSGVIRYKDSSLEFDFWYSNLFGINAILHHAADAVRSQSGLATDKRLNEDQLFVSHSYDTEFIVMGALSRKDKKMQDSELSNQ